MEFISGSSLAQHVAKGPLHGRRAAAYLEAVARSVHYAHTRGILHRDLKPANVLLDAQDQPKITDFGLAKLLSTESGQTRTGAVLGTPSYMSPEQASGRKDVSTASDVWSLGAILYELLTGKPPFRGETPLATLTLVAEQDPVAPRLLNPAIDRDLETICLKCLEKAPSRRYESAEALADDLRRYLVGEPISARRLSRVGRAVKWCRRKPTAAGLLAVSCLAVVAFMLISWWNAAVERELRADAEQSREEARNSLKEQRRLLYLAKMRQAQEALQIADHRRADKLLGEWIPKDDEADLRDWEWYFLKERSDGRFSLRGHEKRATAVAYRPDGKRLASAGGPVGQPNDIKIWDPARGHRLRTLTGHRNVITAIAYSPEQEGKLLASASRDGTVRIWDSESGSELAILTGFSAEPTAVAIRPRAVIPDNRELAIADASGTVTFWRATSATARQWEKVHTVQAHQAAVTAVAFHRLGHMFATAGLDRAVKLWEAGTGKLREVLTADEVEVNEVYCLAFSPTGNRLAVGGGHPADRDVHPSSGEVKFYVLSQSKSESRPESKLESRHFGLSAPIKTLAYSRDRKLAAGSEDGLIRIWDLGRSSECITFRGDTQTVYSLAFSPDNSLACAGRGGQIRLYNSAGGQESLILNEPHNGGIVAFSPDSRRLACSGKNQEGHALVQMWDLDDRELKASIPVRSLATALAFSPKGHFLATGGDDKVLRVYDLLKATEEPREVHGHTGRINALAYHPTDENVIASAGDDKHVHIWDLSDSSKHRVLTGHDDGVLAIAFSPDGRYLASAGQDRTVRVWDLQGRGAEVFNGHTDDVRAVAFRPDSKLLASASSDKTIRLWDLSGRAQPRVLEGSPSPLGAITFHHGGNRLASGGQDNIVRLWDLGTGQEILELAVPAGPLHGVAFSPDGRRLACSGPNIRPRFWEGSPVMP
jgi:WD40 repeat protein